MNVKPDLITVIPSGVEAATQPRKLSGRGQAFHLVAQLTARFAGCLDFARYDKLGALQLDCASHIRYRRGDRLQFVHSPDNHIGVFQSVSSDGANDPAGFPNFLERVRGIVCIAALEKAGDRRRARWLDKNSFMPWPPRLRREEC